MVSISTFYAVSVQESDVAVSFTEKHRFMIPSTQTGRALLPAGDNRRERGGRP